MDLLADRLAQVVRLGGREAGELLGDLHVLLLVDADAVRQPRDRLQARVGVRDRFLPGLAARVAGDVAHRARAVERHERDQVLELGRLDLAQRLAHARRLELEDADRVALLQHLVGGRVVERELGDVDPADELERLVDHVEVAQAEEVHLQQAERLDVAHLELGHDLLVAALLLQRHDVGERAVRDHDTGGVDRVLAHEPFERLGEVDDLLHLRVGVVGLLQLGAGLEALVEVDLRPFRDQLRDLVDDAVGDLEHAPGVAHRGAGHHRPEGDDLGDAIAPVLLGDVVDDAIAAGDGEVDVHVGHGLAARVEEALEQQPVADRVDVGDVEAVRRERARRRAAPRAHRDPASLGEGDEVPDDQEVVGEAHLLDRLELEAQALGQLRRCPLVALFQAFFAELDEVLEGVLAFRDRELRQQDLAELELDVAARGDLQRAPHRLLVAREVERHLLRRLEEELIGVELPVVRVLERVARLDAEQRLVRARVFVPEVVHVAGRDERQARLARELRQAGVDPRLDLEARVLHLDVGRVAPEDLREPVEVGAGVVGPVLLERLADAAGEAAGERDQSLRVPLEQLPVDPRLVVVALEVAGRGELDQVRVAGVVLGEQREVRVALLLRVAVLGDVELAAENRLDSDLARLLVELDRAGERAVIGERHRRHLELGRAGGEPGYAARPVENRVLGVDVQVNKASFSHGGTSLRIPEDDLLQLISSTSSFAARLAPRRPPRGRKGTSSSRGAGWPFSIRRRSISSEAASLDSGNSSPARSQSAAASA